MTGFALSSERLFLRSVEEAEIAEIRALQNGECRYEISGMLDFDPAWAPMSTDQVKSKLEEVRKEERTAVFAIWSTGEELIGMGRFSAEWDPQCPFLQVVVWPEHRRKGFGSEAAALLLELCFGQSVARVVSCWVPEWNRDGLAFAESLGFRRCGIERRAGIRDGRFFDGVFLDMLRGEYFDRRAHKEVG
jgi:RimJ/RimL family protein N-acetyltransferase